jgi:hypothetical protein
MKLLLNLPNPTDVLVVGTYIVGVTHFSTRDDYDSILLENIENPQLDFYCETDGSVSILTVQDFIDLSVICPNFLEGEIVEEDVECYFVLLKKQQGNIYLKIEDTQTGKDITPLDLNLEDYLCQRNLKKDFRILILFERESETFHFTYEDLIKYLRNGDSN